MAATQAPRPRPATPTDVSAAIAERRRREQRRRTRTMALVAGALALALVLVWLVRFSPVLAVRDVQVTGTRRLSQAAVVEAARVPAGKPLVQVDTDAVGRRVAGLLEVSQVHVHTKLPRTVVIDVTERTAVYQRGNNGQYQLVDGQGVIFATQPTPAKGVLVAETGSVDNRLLADVATVVQSLPPALAKRVQQVKAPSPDQIELRLASGQQVVWGSAAASQDKARVLQVLLTRKASWIDVSSPQSPATR